MKRRADNPAALAYVGSAPGEKKLDSDAWFTPGRYIAAARACMGSIDYDPYSSDAANGTVEAAQYATVDRPNPDRGVAWPKVRTCWMNPPYSGKAGLDAAKRFLEAYAYERFEQGIVLVNNSTETKAFRALVADAEAICFTDHRIQFYNADGKKVTGNTRGQAFLYFGKDASASAFVEHFSQFGTILRPL